LTFAFSGTLGLFTLLYVTISTVAIALAISLTGISSGAANLGICAAGFGLAIAGFEKNGWGTSLASVLGILAGTLGIVGTPMSAGFGISGLIGPLNHLGIVGYSFGNWIITILVFLILPIVLGFVFKILKAEDYAIEV
jgi:uncharacterized membrane protein